MLFSEPRIPEEDIKMQLKDCYSGMAIKIVSGDYPYSYGTFMPFSGFPYARFENGNAQSGIISKERESYYTWTKSYDSVLNKLVNMQIRKNKVGIILTNDIKIFVKPEDIRPL